mmetsp:Transcript_33413/g.60250  ORF Transcript_33413/g.60250 Transcript_33413/m.60250 type:complete len:537 (+) Transcript_33413:93-1703(+)
MSPHGYLRIILVLHCSCRSVGETSSIMHTSKTENLEDEVSLVQLKMATQPHRSEIGVVDHAHTSKQQKQSTQEDYWPQPRGGPSHYSRTPHGLPQEVLQRGDLTGHLAWKWEHPEGLDTFVCGTLIDKDKNIYLIVDHGLYKLNPDGEVLWQREDITGIAMGAISGNALCAMEQGRATMNCVDTSSGKTLWNRTVAESTGKEGDMVTSNNGVVVAAVGSIDIGFGASGTASERAIGLNASTGDELWTYKPDCAFWNIMGLFPDEDTVIVMDSCGGLYRLGLYNGSELWKRAPDRDAFTDGGATLGPDGSIYTCTDEPGSHTMILENGNMDGIKGRVRKFKLGTGEMVWETPTAHACLNFPAISPDGKTMVLADGANVLQPAMFYFSDGMSREAKEKFYKLQQQWLEEKIQLSMWGQDNINASLMGFDTETGKMKWQTKMEPWWGMSFARDEERSYNYKVNGAQHRFCGPPHWGGPTIDENGNIYIGRSDGNLYLFNPEGDSEIKFETKDGMLMAGVTFAPGMMVVPSCSFVYVFRY